MTDKYLDDTELAAFTSRITALTTVETILTMMREGSNDFVKQLSEKYEVPATFQVNQRTGQIILKTKEVTKIKDVPPSNDVTDKKTKPAAKKKVKK